MRAAAGSQACWIVRLVARRSQTRANERILTLRKPARKSGCGSRILSVVTGRRSQGKGAAVPPLLEIVGLHKSFGPVRALSGADLSLWPGEVLALVGDNGAGKSTLIKHIAGVYRADAGEIRLNGAPLDLHGPADARRLGIETVYQDLALADDLSVGANVFLGREPVRRLLGLLAVIDNRKIRDETEALLRRVESRIPPKARTVSRLSGGQRQAVAIARALYWQ